MAKRISVAVNGGERSTPNVGRISVLLVDRHVLTRIGARAVLEAEKDIHVVGECDNADDALKLATSLRPAVVIVDLLSGEARGFGLIRELRAHAAPTTRTLACCDALPDRTIQHLLSI